MMMRILVFALAIIATLSSAIAQDIIDYVPNDVPIVFTFNAENIKDKVSMKELTDLPLYKKYKSKISKSEEDRKMFEFISEFYEAPQQVGLSWNPRSYAYLQKKDSFLISTFLWKLSDSKKFAQKIAQKKSDIRKLGKIKYIIGSDNKSKSSAVVLAWSKDIATLIVANGNTNFIQRSVPYSDTARYTKIDLMYKQFAEKLQKVAIGRIKTTLKLPKSSVLKNANYKLFARKKYDLGVWINTEKIAPLIQERQKGSRYGFRYRQLFELIDKLSKYNVNDNFVHLFVHLNDGEARLEMQSFIADKLDKLVQKVYQNKIDESLLQFLKGKNALSYAGVSLDLPQMLNLSREYFDLAFKEDSLGKIMLRSLDVLDIAIDQDALTGLFEGDFVTNVSDFQKVNSTYTTYEYDANYERKKVEKTRQTVIPVMTMLTKIGNKSNIQKILALAEATGNLENKGGYYVVTKIKDIALFVRIKNDILMVTNDPDIVYGKYKNGVPNSEQLSEKAKKALRSNSVFSNTDIQNIIQRVLDVNAGKMPPAEIAGAQLFKKYFDMVQFIGEGSKENYKREVIIKMKDKNEHFLKQFMSFLYERDQ